MRIRINAHVAFIAVLLLTFACFSEGFVAPRGGVMFPQVIRDLNEPPDRIAWNVGLDWGGLGDLGVGGGGYFDVAWKWNNNASRFDNKYVIIDTLSGSTIDAYEVDREVRRTMFSFGAQMVADPIKDFIVHPAIRGSFGPAMLIYINRKYVEDTTSSIIGYDPTPDYDSELIETSGIYWGFWGRVGVDLHFNLSRGTSVFVGADYQWGVVTKRKWGTNTRYQQSLHGMTLHAGFRFL